MSVRQPTDARSRIQNSDGMRCVVVAAGTEPQPHRAPRPFGPESDQQCSLLRFTIHMGLPTGTVTLLFSDIEGSTRLVMDLGESWVDVLEQHRMLCRAAWSAYDGQELGTEGDSFFVVFDSASAAVASAVAAQQALFQATWPESVNVRVRMGMHTGSPTRHRDGYVGMDVHRAARIAGAAHGRQVLISEATADQVRANADDSVTLVDLGLHRLRDIPERMRLFQLSVDGLPAHFAPLRSRGGAGSLPPLARPIVGRAQDLSHLTAMLAESESPLVTLTGPGGSGKTTLAVAVATSAAPSFVDGVFFVPLVDARCGNDLWPALSAALELPAERQTLSGLLEHVAAMEALFVLDNLEQVTDVDEVITRILAQAPHVKLLTTTRRPLHVGGEVQHAVEPLRLPTGVSFAEIADSPAVQMFVDQAHRIRHEFDLDADNARLVSRLCAAVDGLPLGIELIAARSKMWSPRTLAAHVDELDGFANPAQSRHARHSTLRAMIAWSFDLLSPAARHVVLALSVCDGGASLDDLAAITTVEGLDGGSLQDLLFELIDASLVGVVETDHREPRFSMLETVKRYARDQALADGIMGSMVQRHSQRFYDVAKSYEASRRGPAYAGLRSRYLDDVPNLRSLVIRGARDVADSSYGEDAVPFAHTVSLVMEQAMGFRRYYESLALSQIVLTDAESLAETDPAGVAAVLIRRARVLTQLGDPHAAIELCDRAAKLTHDAQMSSDSPKHDGLPRWADPYLTAHLANFDRAYAYLATGDLERSRVLCAELLRTSATLGLAERAQAQLINVFQSTADGDFDAARTFSDREGELYMRNRDEEALAQWINNAAFLDLYQGHPGKACERIAADVPRLRTRGDPKDTIYAAETFSVAIGYEHPKVCARLRGAAAQARLVEGVPFAPGDTESDEEFLKDIRTRIDPEEWECEFRAGQSENLMDLMEKAASLLTPEPS